MADVVSAGEKGRGVRAETPGAAQAENPNATTSAENPSATANAESPRLRVVFMGTPDFAVPSLEALASAHEVALVLTRPDAVRGRGRALVPSPVKARALELGLPVLETSRVTPEILDRLREVEPDVICVAAYGCILPDEVLALAPFGCVNVHASLLPRWRGAAPVQRAILAGDERTGVSIMRIGHGVDTGAYCAQASTTVAGKGADELTAELARMGADLLVETLPAVADGTAAWVEQDEALVTHAAKVTKAEMLLDPADAAAANLARVLASGDTAPARCQVCVRGVRACAARAGERDVAPGAVLASHGRVWLGCADGSVELLRVKPDGKREMDASAWAAGLRGDGLTWERA